MAFAETVRQPSLNSQQSTTTTTTTTTQSNDQHSHHPHHLFANAFNVTRSSDSSLSSMSSSTSSTTNRINSFHRRRLNSHHNHMMYRTGSGNRNGRTTTRLTTSTTTPPMMMDEETAYRIMMQQREEAFARARREAHADLEAEHELMERRAVVQQQFQQQAQQQARTTIHHHHQQQPQHQTNPSTSNGIRTNPSANGSNGQAQHRVYLINCRSCGSFLTDRGMKAVLLLRPHITLYSTDAMPNCGPLHQPSRLAEPSLPNEPIVERTCDCLTQTLGCFGCGNAVGYHIVSPCLRCTNSVAKHQKSSNGHRTVLHCAEISVRERRYVPGEPGVLVAPYQPPPLPMPRSVISSRYQSSLRRMADEQEEDLDEEDEEMDEEEDEEDEEEVDEEEEDEFGEANDKSYREESMNGMRNGLIFPISPYRMIKRGDVLFWSDLAPGGERSIPIDSDDYLDQPLAGR